MTTELVSLIIALVAVIVSPGVTIWITKKNFEFQFRSTVQDKWLDKLEKSAIQYLNNSAVFRAKHQSMLNDLQDERLSKTEFDAKMETFVVHLHESLLLLELHLDDKKQLQNEILSLINQIDDTMSNMDYSEEAVKQVNHCHEKVVEKLRQLFREERNKVAKLFR